MNSEETLGIGLHMNEISKEYFRENPEEEFIERIQRRIPNNSADCLNL